MLNCSRISVMALDIYWFNLFWIYAIFLLVSWITFGHVLYHILHSWRNPGLQTWSLHGTTPQPLVQVDSGSEAHEIHHTPPGATKMPHRSSSDWQWLAVILWPRKKMKKREEKLNMKRSSMVKQLDDRHHRLRPPKLITKDFRNTGLSKHTHLKGHEGCLLQDGRWILTRQWWPRWCFNMAEVACRGPCHQVSIPQNGDYDGNMMILIVNKLNKPW